ncbi:MAG: hypothetical protein QXW53_01250 [Desulfurococcaceae archaeon]
MGLLRSSRTILFAVLVAQLILLGLLTQLVVVGSGDCLSTTFFYVYGSTQCPYCRSLDAFFNQSFPEKHYFCPVNLDEKCYKEYEVLVTSITGRDAVPQTLVLRNESGRLVATAIVIGAVMEQSFWEQLACGKPVNEIPIYSGVKQVASAPANSVINFIDTISGLSYSYSKPGISGTSTTVNTEGCLSNVLFYMYGQTTCPHCSSQDNFFKQYFPHNYFYCPIDKYRECYDAASRFVSFLASKGVPLDIARSIPQIVALKNDTDSPSILAVVVGELRERSFWLQLACSAPSTVIPVYVSTGSSGSPIAMIDVNTMNHSGLINNYIVFPTTHSEALNSQTLGVIVVVIVLTVTIGGYTIYARTRRRVKRPASSRRGS